MQAMSPPKKLSGKLMEKLLWISQNIMRTGAPNEIAVFFFLKGEAVPFGDASFKNVPETFHFLHVK